MKSAFVKIVKIGLIGARNFARAQNRFGPWRWAVTEAANILHRTTNVKPIMFRVTATSEAVIGGPRYPVNRERQRRRTFSANQRYVESNLLTSVARGGPTTRFTQGMTFWRARDSCTAYRLLLNAVSRAASPIYMVSLCFYQWIRAFQVSFRYA